MAKSEDEDDNKLDVVLINALRENFEIREGHHMDRHEMLEFLKTVIEKHTDLEFVLHHRDTKLSGRIYKAFPRVTTKRVAVPNERGKKVWRYTNLKRILPVSEQSSVKELVQDEIPKNEDKTENDSLLPVPEKSPEEQEEQEQQESCVPEDSSMENKNDSPEECADNSVSDLTMSSELINSENSETLESDLGQFSDMLKWIKDHFELNTNSSVQVKCVVDGMKAAFHTDITYKQSHKLIFSVFPGASSRVVNPVRLEGQGSFYSYRGIATKSEQPPTAEEPVSTDTIVAKSKPARRSRSVKSVCAKQTWIPPFGVADNAAKTKAKQSRKQFLKSCAVLKDNLDPLKNYDGFPASPDSTTMMERESAWQRMVDEIKQERDQAIKERNQAMISLMELERDPPTESRSAEDASSQLAVCHDVAPRVSERPSVEPKSEENMNESRDWLRSLINRSNHILGEQMSEANSKYFPGLTLQNASSPPRPAKYPRYSGEFIEIDRYEKLKSERDLIWKSLMEKMKREKEEVIQQLKLEKMEVIQKMELEKSDVIEGVQETLTNQITILSRELRELKELLNHTMDERTLAIEHAQKLVKLVDEKTLKEANLESFPFDVMEDQCVHLPRQKSTDEAGNQIILLPATKVNKRKQSMPAKLKKNGKPASNFEKYVTAETCQDSTLCFSSESDNSVKSTVSSIDCLNSIVQNIGRNSPCQSPKNYSSRTDFDCSPSVEG